MYINIYTYTVCVGIFHVVTPPPRKIRGVTQVFTLEWVLRFHRSHCDILQQLVWTYILWH
jgi:hypothetical protein